MQPLWLLYNINYENEIVFTSTLQENTNPLKENPVKAVFISYFLWYKNIINIYRNKHVF